VRKGRRHGPPVPQHPTGADYDPPAELPGVQLELQRIVYRALAKDPHERYQSCAELLHDLEEVKPLLGPASSTAETWRNSTATQPLQASRAAASKSAIHAIPQRRNWLPWVVAAVILFLVSPALLSVTTIRDRGQALLGTSNPRYVAVLPFENVGNDPKNEALLRGLTDSLSGKLSNLDPDKAKPAKKKSAKKKTAKKKKISKKK